MFDLAGSVAGFLRAAAGVDGLEFLADLQEDQVEPDDDFYYEAEGEVVDDRVPQSLYMVMTNAQAVAELVRMFELWQEDQSVKFDIGLNPLKQVFGLLRTIRRWGPQFGYASPDCSSSGPRISRSPAPKVRPASLRSNCGTELTNVPALRRRARCERW